MIYRCPHCGHELNRPIQRGIKMCEQCRAFFEANDTNKLLSAAWELRKSHHLGLDAFKFRSGLDDTESQFVYHYISELGYSHDEFLKIVKEDVALAV